MLTKLIVIQPTSFCNLNCKYCYVPGRKDNQLMSFDIVDACARVISNSKVTEPTNPDEKLIISWHTGEPLTAGLPFYEYAMKSFSTHNHKNINFSMNIQTNGLLINQSWCDFFNEHKFVVCTSVDGPELIHNHQRVGWNNSGSFAKVMRGADLLKKNKISLNTITVLTDYSLDYPDEMYQFFKETGFDSVAFNIDEQDGMNDKSSYLMPNSQEYNPTAIARYKQFMSRFFDLWFSDGRPFMMREFDNLLRKIKFYKDTGYSRFTFATESIAFANIGISKTGSIVTFSPELNSGIPNDLDAFTIGNILDIETFEELTKNDNYKKQYEDVAAGVKNCAKECEFFDFCGGGSAANKYYEKGTFTATETVYCYLTRKVLYNLLFEKLEAICKVAA